MECAAEQSVLDGLLAAGIAVPHVCRSGLCRACVVRARAGYIPAAAQKGLRESQKAAGQLLACQCVPAAEGDPLRLEPADELPTVGAILVGKERLAPDVVRLRLAVEGAFSYRAGQYVYVRRADGLERPYSLASVPGADSEGIELHVRQLFPGRMSGFLADEAPAGERFTLRGPTGDCCYGAETDRERPLVLVGTGTGLAPLWAIARDALAQGHRGPVFLHHGARTARGLYGQEDLRKLTSAHVNFSYQAHVLEGPAPSDAAIGALDEPVRARAAAHRQARFFLCGDPGLVQSLRKAIFLAGVPLGRIHADAFATAPPPQAP